jgi:hypothetical protein
MKFSTHLYQCILVALLTIGSRSSHTFHVLCCELAVYVLCSICCQLRMLYGVLLHAVLLHRAVGSTTGGGTVTLNKYRA